MGPNLCVAYLAATGLHIFIEPDDVLLCVRLCPVHCDKIMKYNIFSINVVDKKKSIYHTSMWRPLAL